MDTKREMLRHCVATLAYRGGKVLRSAPPDFIKYRASETTRTPGQILAHLCDLLDWALSMAQGKQKWNNSTVETWQAGSDRFFAALTAFDERLADSEPLGETEEKLFQGPVADSLTHVGQLAMLCRMAGTPVKGENYHVADIQVGSVGAEQKPARFEFD